MTKKELIKSILELGRQLEKSQSQAQSLEILMIIEEMEKSVDGYINQYHPKTENQDNLKVNYPNILALRSSYGKFVQLIDPKTLELFWTDGYVYWLEDQLLETQKTLHQIRVTIAEEKARKIRDITEGVY